VFSLYSQAVALECDKLVNDLTDLIITELLNIGNVAHFYADAIQFSNDRLCQACEDLLISKFDDIQTDSRDFICSIPVAQFVKLLLNDELNIQQESSLVSLVKDFIKRRSQIKEEPVWGPPAETTDPNVWKLLSAEEKKVRNDQFAEQDKERTAALENARLEREKQYKALKGHDQIQFALDIRNKLKIEKIKIILTPTILTEEEKQAIFSCIRYSFIPHEELLKLSVDPEFEEARELVIQGLSRRLDSYETAPAKDIAINLQPRNHYRVDEEDEHEQEANISMKQTGKVAGQFYSKNVNSDINKQEQN
jgi:hypothetical protein